MKHLDGNNPKDKHYEDVEESWIAFEEAQSARNVGKHNSELREQEERDYLKAAKAFAKMLDEAAFQSLMDRDKRPELQKMLDFYGLTPEKLSEITGHTVGSIKSMLAPGKKVPRWVNLALHMWEHQKLIGFTE